MLTREDILHNFKWHPPRNDDEKLFYEMYREAVLAPALLAYDTLFESPERTIAIRHLEEAVMWANAACARHGLYDKPRVTLGPSSDETTEEK